ncbi:thiolase family protein [Myxococcota bacterium]|nr:thiolase family protein [Myxococcota bacterium]
MSGSFTARCEVAVVGYAHSVIQRNAPRTLGAIALETALSAIADAGLTREQIDGFTTGSLLPSAGGHASVDGVSIVTSNWLAEKLGLNPRFAAGFQGFGQLAGGVMLAVNAVATGAADYVVFHRALHNPRGVRYHVNPMTEARGSSQWTAPQGYFGPLAMIGLPYNEYLQRYGASREAMAEVLVEARANGARIPWSYWHNQPITAQDYLDARVIVDPICMLDCDIPVDGVAAFVLTRADRARDLPNKPVYVAGYAQGSVRRPRLPVHWPLDDIMEAGFDVARRLEDSSGLSLQNVDLPQLYDGFSPFIYFWLESLGFCKVGEAHEFVQDGGIRTEGGLPVLSGGGALGNGRMHGVPQMLECYLQLSGRAGERQISSATLGLACHSSPHYGGAVLYSSEPL